MNDISKNDLENLNKDLNNQNFENKKEVITTIQINEKFDKKLNKKEEDIFSLYFQLFHLKLSKKKFLVFKKVGFKSHLISNLKKKIALLKKSKKG